MDDTLYYVESPDGQVLGPMTMMHILEGVAAGAVLEEARICEVGQSEWIELADVAYTREVEPTGRLMPPARGEAIVREPRADAAPAEPPPAFPSPQDLREVVVDESGSDGDPVWAAEIEGALAALESEALGEDTTESAEPIDRTAFPAPDLAGLPDQWHSKEVAEGPAPMPMHARPPVESRPEPPAWHAAPTAPVHAEHAQAAHAESLEPVSDPDSTVVMSPGAADMPGEPEVAPEFALNMEQAEAAPDDMETASPARRFALPMPVLVAVALAVVGGVYIAMSGKFQKDSAPAPAAAGPDAATTAAADPAQAGWAAIGAGDFAKAFELLGPAAKANPDDARVQHGFGVAALETGKPDVAATHLEKAAELSSEDARVHVDLGRARLAQGRPELAVEEAQRAQALDASESAALLLLGRAHAAAKRPDDAVKALAAFVEASPKNTDAHKDLARALADAGRVAPAVDEASTYLQARPSDRGMQQARLDWMLAIGQDVAAAKLYPADDRNDAFAQFLAGTARIGTEDGVACLRRAVELDPGHRDAWARLADAQAAVGHTKDAVDSIQRAFALSPATAQEKRLVTKWSAAKDKTEVATTTTPRVETPTSASTTPVPALPDPKPAPVAKTPTVVPLADRIEDIRRSLARSDFAGARRTSEAARAELPGGEAARNLDLWNAIIAFEEGRFDEAQKGLEALDAAASYAGFGQGTVYNWIGRVLLARGQARAAIGAFDQVPAEDPNEYAAAQLWEGVAMSSLGMNDLATRTWSRIREDVGGRAGSAGKAAVRSADFLSGAIAEKDYRTALSSSPEFENDMYFFLGWAARNDADTARARFREAVDASRGREFPFHLAQSEVQSGTLGQ